MMMLGFKLALQPCGESMMMMPSGTKSAMASGQSGQSWSIWRVREHLVSGVWLLFRKTIEAVGKQKPRRASSMLWIAPSGMCSDVFASVSLHCGCPFGFMEEREGVCSVGVEGHGRGEDVPLAVVA
eukprot:2617750-Rhodomonas_salina.1